MHCPRRLAGHLQYRCVAGQHAILIGRSGVSREGLQSPNRSPRTSHCQADQATFVTGSACRHEGAVPTEALWHLHKLLRMPGTHRVLSHRRCNRFASGGARRCLSWGVHGSWILRTIEIARSTASLAPKGGAASYPRVRGAAGKQGMDRATRALPAAAQWLPPGPGYPPNRQQPIAAVMSNEMGWEPDSQGCHRMRRTIGWPVSAAPPVYRAQNSLPSALPAHLLSVRDRIGIY